MNTKLSPTLENEERNFLHDLATPLGVALLLTDSILDDLQNRPNSDPDDLMRLVETYQALEKLNQLIQKRREILKNEESEYAQP